MPNWLAGELGYVFAIVGFILIVCEWRYVFDTQGNMLARQTLQYQLREWRELRDGDIDTCAALKLRMRETASTIRDAYQRHLFIEYVDKLPSPSNTSRLDDLDRAFAAGTPIEEWEKRTWRRKLMILGAILVVVGNLLQMVGTYPFDLASFCKREAWTCK